MPYRYQFAGILVILTFILLVGACSLPGSDTAEAPVPTAPTAAAGESPSPAPSEPTPQPTTPPPDTSPTSAESATPQPTSTPGLPTALVTNGGNLRSEPRIAPDTVLAQVCPGDRVELLEQEQREDILWQRIRVLQLAEDCVTERADIAEVGWLSSVLLSEPTAAAAPVAAAPATTAEATRAARATPDPAATPRTVPTRIISGAEDAPEPSLVDVVVFPGPDRPVTEGTPITQPEEEIDANTVARLIEVALWGTAATTGGSVAQFSPDSAQIFTDIGGAALWNVRDGTLVYGFDAAFATVNDVAFAADGQTFATAGPDAAIRIWQASNGTLLQVIEGHTGPVNSLDYSPDGQLLVSGAEDSTVRVWDVLSATSVYTFESFFDPVLSVAFAPDGESVVAGAVEPNIFQWRVSDGTLVQTFSGHTEPVNDVTFAPDGQTLASASNDNTVRLWRVLDGELLQTLEAHLTDVQSVDFSPDGLMLASASQDNSGNVGQNAVLLWRVGNGELLLSPGDLPAGAAQVDFSPDGTLLAVALRDNTLRLWGVKPLDTGSRPTLAPPEAAIDVDNASRVVELVRREGHLGAVESVDFSPDGQLVASGAADQTIQAWRVNDGSLLYAPEERGDRVIDTAFVPGTDLLAYVADEAYLRQVSDGSLVRALPLNDDEQVEMLAVAPNGDTIAYATLAINLENVVPTVTPISEPTAPTEEEAPAAVEPPPPAPLPATSYRIRLWRTGDSATMPPINDIDGPLNGMTFTPDGRVVATLSGPGVQFWRASNGELLNTIEIGAPTQSLAFSSDGAYLAVGLQDGSIQMWQMLDGTQLYALAGHAGGVTDLVFSSDNTALISASLDGTVRLWRVADGTAVREITGHTDAVLDVALSRDGTLLASASADTTVRLWGVAP